MPIAPPGCCFWCVLLYHDSKQLATLSVQVCQVDDCQQEANHCKYPPYSCRCWVYSLLMSLIHEPAHCKDSQAKCRRLNEKHATENVAPGLSSPQPQCCYTECWQQYSEI